MLHVKIEPRKFENSFERVVAPVSVVNLTPNKRPTGDCFEALIRAFRKTPRWLLSQSDGGYSEATKKAWARQLDYMSKPEMLGAYAVRELSKELVKTFFLAIADRPGKQQTCLTVLRVMEAWAIENNFLVTPVTSSVEIIGSKAGHMPWTEEHIALALRHLPPMLARAVLLALLTGQRGSDIVKMGPRSIRERDGIRGIELVQQKTGHKTKAKLFIPIVPELDATMSTWEDTQTFLHNEEGGKLTRNALSARFARARNSIAALSPLRLEPDPIAPDDRKEYLQIDDHFSIGEDNGLVLHGLRGSACVRLRRRGASEGEISKWIGMSIPMVTRYTRGTDQAADTIAAARRLGFFPVEQSANVIPLRA